MAAVRDDWDIVVPIAYRAKISNQQLIFLPMKNRLRVFCAGIWHNILLSIFAILLLEIITLGLDPFFKSNTGIFVLKISQVKLS